MSRCLVLGANGFIGSHLVDKLYEEGHSVRCFGRYKSKDAIFNNNDSSNIEIFRGDFLSTESLENALENIDYVFHFISTTNPLTAENDPVFDLETNTKMSVELLKLCSMKNVKKVIFASTGGAVYGEVNSDRSIGEDICPKPISPYAISKLSVENYLRYFNQKYGLKYNILRISNPYGPRQNTLSGQGVISIFLEKIKINEPITVFGDGSMIRDYIYISDLVDMISSIFEKDSNETLYNVGSGTGYSINQIIESIESVTGIKAQIMHKDAPSTFISKVVLDTDKFTTEFGIKPKIDLEQGIKLTWDKINEV